MKPSSYYFSLILFFLCFLPSKSYAVEACCSYHGGVCGFTCCDSAEIPVFSLACSSAAVDFFHQASFEDVLFYYWQTRRSLPEPDYCPEHSEWIVAGTDERVDRLLAWFYRGIPLLVSDNGKMGFSDYLEILYQNSGKVLV